LCEGIEALCEKDDDCRYLKTEIEACSGQLLASILDMCAEQSITIFEAMDKVAGELVVKDQDRDKEKEANSTDSQGPWQVRSEGLSEEHEISYQEAQVPSKNWA
jgi:hypothetical protein